MNNNVFKYKQKLNKTGTPNYEFLETPPEICDWMQALLIKDSTYKPHQYLDPCMGKGKLGDAIRRFDPNAHIVGFDIQDFTPNRNYDVEIKETDFLGFTTTLTYDAVICNPPFSLAPLFIEKCWNLLRDNGVMSFILPVSYWFSVGRLSTLHNPTNTYCLAPRVSFTGNKITSPKDEYIICTWEKNSNEHNIQRLLWK